MRDQWGCIPETTYVPAAITYEVYVYLFHRAQHWGPPSPVLLFVTGSSKLINLRLVYDPLPPVLPTFLPRAVIFLAHLAGRNSGASWNSGEDANLIERIVHLSDHPRATVIP